MSQVIRKFENSGKIEQSKPELFERSGVGKYNKADLVAGLYRNIDTYIKNNNLSGDKAVSFRDSANQFIKGIENGTISMNGDGTFSDATGSMASTGKFDKNWIGRKKDTTNNAFNLVGDYALDYINQMQQYTEPAAKPKSKFNTNDFLTKEISKRWYGGNDIDFGNWFKNRSEQDRNALLGDIFNNADYNQLYQDYDWTDTGINSAEDLATRGRTFSTAISNNTLDNDDYNTFATLGGSGLDKFLKEAPVQTEPTPEQNRMKAWEAEAEAAGATTPEAKATDRTPEQVEAGERKPMADGQDWEYEDYARLVSAGADVGSMIASFVPGYGTAASAALGVGSTIGNFTADLADESVGVGSAFLNAGAGLGMDLVGLIPGLGAAGKGSKIVKNLLKVAPKLITIWSASTSFAPAMQAFNKLKDKGAKEMTVDDWKALANGLTAAAGATRWGAAAAKNKINTHKYGTTTRTVTTKSGKQVQMSEEEFQRIKRASGIEGQNEALQAVEGAKGEQLPTTFKKWYDVRRAYQGTPDVDKNTVINTDAMRRTAPDGTILEPTKFSNQGIWRGAVNNDWGHNWKGWKGPKWLKDWGYAPAPLALPAPGQATPSNRVFVMGSGKPNTPRDVTNPSNLKKPGSYTDRAVPVGGTPVESPNANAVRTVRTINSILEPFVSQPRNLPAVIPASRNAKKVVASQTIQPTQRLDQFIEGQIPGGLVYGRARTKREREYRDIFHPVVEREQNTLWDQLTSTPEYRNRLILTNQPQGVQAGPTAPIDLFTETQKNVRKSLQVSESRKERSRNNALPHKPKPKKKKTSRDDRVTKKAEGGIVQFLQGGNTVGRIKAKDMSNWNRANALANYDWIADYDRWASQHEGPDDVVDSYILAFNGGEDIYDQLTSKTGDYFGGKYNYSVQDPLAKHRQITFRGTNQGFDDLIRKGIVGYGTTEGNSGFDIYAGDRTGNRTLARGMSPEDVARFNKQLATRGMELYDKGNGAYRLRRLEQKPVELPEVVVTADTPKTPATTNPSAIKGAAPKKGKGFNLGVMPEDVIALGRMVGGLAANNKAAKLYKEGLKPTLLDTFENTVPLQGNFQATTNAEQQAGNLESVAARPRTSDASLQLAGELEASGRAGQARFQGGLQDAEMFYKTRMLGQQESDAAKARRVDVANRNRASMNQIDAAKKQIDAARVTSNYQNVIAPYLAGVENQFAQKRAMNQQLDMEEAQREAERTYSPEFDRLTQDYKNAYKAYGAANNNNYTGWETSNEYKSLVNRRKSLNDNVSQFLLDKRRGIMGSPYMFQVKKNSSIKTPYVKSGGKLSAADREKLQRAKDFNKRLLEDNKQFHKDIMESKREHNKLIMSMSSLTSELIKKAMS